MDRETAEQIIDGYYCKEHRSEDDFFELTEALKYLIDTTGVTRYMMMLGGQYYERRDFDLALKYYDMASEKGDSDADECLGYVYYYGRVGEPDYEKAFMYFSRGMERGNVVSAYKVADMYKNGYFVERDYGKYAEIVESLWSQYSSPAGLSMYEPYPEIGTRMAGVLMKRGENGKALDILYRVRPFLEYRMRHTDFFGNFTIMKFMIADIYRLTPVDYSDFGFYDLYEILKTPCTVSFMLGTAKHVVKSEEDEGVMVVSLDGKYYRNIDAFMSGATCDGERLAALTNDMYLFRKES